MSHRGRVLHRTCCGKTRLTRSHSTTVTHGICNRKVQERLLAFRPRNKQMPRPHSSEASSVAALHEKKNTRAVAGKSEEAAGGLARAEAKDGRIQPETETMALVFINSPAAQLHSRTCIEKQPSAVGRSEEAAEGGIAGVEVTGGRIPPEVWMMALFVISRPAMHLGLRTSLASHPQLRSRTCIAKQPSAVGLKLTAHL